MALAAIATSPPPSRWTLRSIRATFSWLSDFTLSGVWRHLQSCRIRLRQGRLPLYSPDPDYAGKEAAQAPKDVVVLFLDEMGYFRWPDAALDWAEAAPASAPESMRAGPNNRQQRIIGALNARTGRVNHIYAPARRIYVIQDNWSIYQPSDVLTALAKFARLEPVWLPTYAPWLNPIEKLWRWLRQDVLKLHRLAGDWPALRQRVRFWINLPLGRMLCSAMSGCWARGALPKRPVGLDYRFCESKFIRLWDRRDTRR